MPFNRTSIIVFFKTKPVFLLLLPVFFVLNGFTQNYNSVSIGDALLLVLLYSGAAFLLAAIAFFFNRDFRKAAIISFLLMAYNFFFGNLQDFLKNAFPHSVISQYRFIIPASLFIFLAICIWLRKRKKPPVRLSSYLNLLLLVLIIIDAGWLVSKITSARSGNDPGLVMNDAGLCDTCQRPDIFLILLDQYAGNTALKDVFHFDNSAFENELEQRGFHIAKKSSSNYNLTPFSMASALDMNYLSPEMGVKKDLNVGYSYRVIRSSQALKFLDNRGYRFYNHSVFDFPGQPAHKYGSFFPYGTKLITARTFIGRIKRDIESDILTGKIKFKAAQKRMAYKSLYYNDEIFQLTHDIALQKTKEPKFVYAHFMMPHYPYYFDSGGRPLPLEKLLGIRKTDTNDYVEYLRYCNKKILALTDHIMKNAATPPIILILSDHGFRRPEQVIDDKYDFINLNATFFPNRDYTRFYDSITNVNQFRVIFNTYFNQRLPLLKDSTTDLWD